MQEEKIGVINEIGDLGLGFDELNKEEEEQIKNQKKKEQNKNKI